MRPLTLPAPVLPSLTRFLVLGALFWPHSAGANCLWNSPTNVFALTGGVCQVSASDASFTAGSTSPIIGSTDLLAYTGFAFFAYGGGLISVTGSNVSITSAAGLTGAYGVYSLGTSSLVTFSNPTSGVAAIDRVTTTGQSAFGLYAAGGGTIVSTAPMAVTTSGNGASGVVADVAGYGAPGVPLYVPPNPGSVTLSGGGSVATSGASAFGTLAAGAGSAINAANMAVTTAGAGSIGLYASRGGVLNASGTTTVTTSGGVSAATGSALRRQCGRRRLGGQSRRRDRQDLRRRRLRTSGERCGQQRRRRLDYGHRSAQRHRPPTRPPPRSGFRAPAPRSWRPGAERSLRRAARSRSSAGRTRPRRSTISPSPARAAISSSPTRPWRRSISMA